MRLQAGLGAPGDLPRPATPLTKRPWVRIEHHARYRYLLQLDGHTCSCASSTSSPQTPGAQAVVILLGILLRRLAPGIHYEPFWTIGHRRARRASQRLDPSSDARMRRVARAGQAFVHRHLNAHAGSATGAPSSRSTQAPPRAAAPRRRPAAQRANMRGCCGPDPRLGPNPASEPHSWTTLDEGGSAARRRRRTSTGAGRAAAAEGRRLAPAVCRRGRGRADGLAAGGAVFTSTMDRRNAEFDP